MNSAKQLKPFAETAPAEQEMVTISGWGSLVVNIQIFNISSVAFNIWKWTCNFQEWEKDDTLYLISGYAKAGTSTTECFAQELPVMALVLLGSTGCDVEDIPRVYIKLYPILKLNPGWGEWEQSQK